MAQDKKDKKKELQKRGRSVVTRTNAEDKKKAAIEKRDKFEKRKTTMLVSAAGRKITPREIFGGVLVPLDSSFKKVAVKIPEIPGGVTLNVISKLGAHKRRDSFKLEQGLTELEEDIEIKAGTVLRFSVDFKGEELEEVFVTGIIQLK